jgi:hypothetical protein
VRRLVERWRESNGECPGSESIQIIGRFQGNGQLYPASTFSSCYSCLDYSEVGAVTLLPGSHATHLCGAEIEGEKQSRKGRCEGKANHGVKEEVEAGGSEREVLS